MRAVKLTLFALLVAVAPAWAQGQQGVPRWPGVTMPTFVIPASLVDGGGGFTPQLFGPLNCSTAPAYSYTTKTNYGWGLLSDELCAVVAGTKRLGISASAVTSSVPYLAPDGTASAPSYTFATNTALGINKAATQYIGFTDGSSVNMAAIGGSGIFLGSDKSLGWGSTTNPVGAVDVSLSRDAAGALALKNGTNAQAFRVYNTYTDASNNEYLTLNFTSNRALIRTVKSGTGTARELTFGTDGSIRWSIGATTGHLLAEADNIYDFGAAGSSRPRTGYFGTSVSSPTYTAPTGNLIIQSASGSNVIINAVGSASLSFRTNSVESWLIGASGHLVAGTDNTYDIGASGATRPRDFFLGRNAVISGTLGVTGTTTLATSLTGILRADSGVVSVDSASANEVVGVAAGYKVARGATAFDGANPTTVATGLTTVVSCTGTLRLTAALTTGTAFVTHAIASGANVDWYAWVIAGTASTGTETFEWQCIGT